VTSMVNCKRINSAAFYILLSGNMGWTCYLELIVVYIYVSAYEGASESVDTRVSYRSVSITDGLHYKLRWPAEKSSGPQLIPPTSSKKTTSKKIESGRPLCHELSRSLAFDDVNANLVNGKSLDWRN